MFKKSMFFIIWVIFCLICVIRSYAQDETLTITTYYPSPYGSYNELETRKLVVGTDTMPTTDGVVNFQGLTSDPASANAGTLYYNSSTNTFKYYNGSQWVDLGGPACIRYSYTENSGIQDCPVNYQFAGVVYMGPDVDSPTTGQYLCCRYE